eukprot:scaffold233702_cov33-Tisochrysis_lutea.AAC.2
MLDAIRICLWPAPPPDLQLSTFTAQQCFSRCYSNKFDRVAVMIWCMYSMKAAWSAQVMEQLLVLECVPFSWGLLYPNFKYSSSTRCLNAWLRDMSVC